ncbi:patatin-like phospholipase family protein [Rhodovulum kholense]|uniref:Patatin-like phospholipase n=1 Tax=Rhodovulum kholense TaxID=453584 RepID=A0A8E3AQJ4_9RHOB|nr:patatin-like phospholipase family protein [Rhodovulum kholense]PTW48259.1 patatin-like phospholipase [Rhodovulum kholense]
MPDTASPPPDTPTGDAPVFLIGLTMAGAVSAGAYSAGVLDYLFRAIDAHNARVRAGPSAEDPAPPRHRVVVKVMTGASAGGMCAGLTLAGLLKGHAGAGEGARLSEGRPVDYPAADGTTAQCRAALEPLFDAWVDQIRFWDPATETGFLATKDLDDPAPLLGAPERPKGAPVPILSVLDSSHLDDATRAALTGVPPLGGKPRYDFLAKDLDVFVTTTGLNGVLYQIRFPGSEYRMQQHGLSRHFRVHGLGVTEHPSAWLDRWGDRGIALDPDQTDAAGTVPFVSDPGSRWYDMTVAALASGAFPVGLAPRTIAATPLQLGAWDPENPFTEGGALTIEAAPDHMVLPRPYFGTGTALTGAATYLAVDGGVINNEPFDIARFTLRRSAAGAALLSNAREGNRADRAVIMIDPFPRSPDYAALTMDETLRLGGLLPSVMRLFPTLVSQARFKIDELLHATNSDVHSRFMIAPVRSETGTSPAARGADAIACGALDGFSGFFARGFRLHDFVLGQRNCQKFLESHFLLDADNPILALDADHPHLQAARAARAKGEAIPEGLRIVDPCVSPGAGLDAEIPMPAWPQIGLGALQQMRRQFLVRLTRIGGHLFDSRAMGGIAQWGLKRLWQGLWPVYPKGLKGDVGDAAARAVLKAFLLRRQLETSEDFSTGVRLAMTALIDAHDEAQSARELRERLTRARETGLYPATLEIPQQAEIERGLLWMQSAGLARRPLSNIFGPPRYAFSSGDNG